MAALNKLRFQVVFNTSEDPDYPASQLNTINPSSKGWQSVRFCSYPQELGFEIVSGETKVSQIQLLSHQNKISTKVEIFIGRGKNYTTAEFKRLGYLSLDSNERSSYQARELKTVFVDYVGSYLKLLVYENYNNKLNLFNQVGIVAISLLTTEELLESKAETGYGSKNSMIGASVINRNQYSDLTVDINLDPHTANKLRQLADAKARAINNEDYMTAKQIKTVEQELKSLGAKLAQLDMAKAEAVAAEDYDLARDIKDECDTLRTQIEQKIRGISIPGVDASATSRKVNKPAAYKGEEDDSAMSAKISSRYDGPSNRFDDMPVGGNRNAAQQDIDTLESESRKSNRYNQEELPQQASAARMQKIPSEVFDDDDRPIKPKQTASYMDQDPLAEKESNDVDGGGSVMPVERFPPGQHPLEGIAGFLDLPTPEPLAAKSREFCETQGIVRAFDEYRARCLFSKSWNVREAVVQKIQRMLSNELGGDITSNLSAVAGVLKMTAEDKIHQVLFAGIPLLEQTMKLCKTSNLNKNTVATAFDPMLSHLVEKLADGNARLREGARKALEIVSASSSLGPGVVCHHLVKPLPPKQKTAWRPIAARLELLTFLVQNYGIGNSGMHLESILSFPKASQAYSHSNGEVRDAAKFLVVALHKIVGLAPLEPTLALLRKNQRAEYEAAFNEAPATAMSGKGRNSDTSAESNIPKRTDMNQQHATQMPGGKVPTSANKVQQQASGYESKQTPAKQTPGKQTPGKDNGEANTHQEFTTCMFCGVHNNKWTENDLDVHYWKDCPLLISCPSCAQIVEIAGLPEHLLDECDAKASYVPCEVTGLAIRADEFENWKNGVKCKPAPTNCMYCPLCLSTVEDSDEAWMNHLTVNCVKNSRKNH